MGTGVMAMLGLTKTLPSCTVIIITRALIVHGYRLSPKSLDIDVFLVLKC